MHKYAAHNKHHTTSREFAGEVFAFQRKKVPRNWGVPRDTVMDNFRVINPENFRVLA